MKRLKVLAVGTVGALILSAIVHLIFFVSCVEARKKGSGEGEGGREGGKFAGDVPVNILEKDKEGYLDCQDSFGGIGIEHNWMHVVTKAPDGNPAAKAGIKVGDQLITPVEYIRGEPGTTIVIELMRNDTEYLKLEIVREKICQGL